MSDAVSLRSPVSCLAVDFGGTLARPGPAVTGAAVAGVLRDRFGVDPPGDYAAGFDAAVRAARTSMAQTRYEELLTALAARHQLLPVPPEALLDALFEVLPDATVDDRAAQALRSVKARGVRCVLACDTQRPLRARLRTLAAAGIADAFDGLVLSSTVGVRKPHPEFYARVLREAGCPPGEVVFVGDTPAKDVLAPRRHGMQAVLIGRDGAGVPPDVPVLGHLSALPRLLWEMS